MFLRKENQSHQIHDKNLFNLDLKKLQEYVNIRDIGGLESDRPKCVLSKKLFELLSAEIVKDNLDFSRIKKILIAAYIENNRLEKNLDQKGFMYHYAVMQGSMDTKYQFDFEIAIQQADNQILPEKIDRGFPGFLKSQVLHKLIYNLFKQTSEQEEKLVSLPKL